MGFKALVPSRAVTEDADHPANGDLAVAEATTMLTSSVHVTKDPWSCTETPPAQGRATG